MVIYGKLIKELSLFRRLTRADEWLMPISANGQRQIIRTIDSGDASVVGRVMLAM